MVLDFVYGRLAELVEELDDSEPVGMRQNA